MAAQAFLLIASFLLVLFLLARPLGTLLAWLIADRSLPGTATLYKWVMQAPIRSVAVAQLDLGSGN